MLLIHKTNIELHISKRQEARNEFNSPNQLKMREHSKANVKSIKFDRKDITAGLRVNRYKKWVIFVVPPIFM